MKQRRGKVFALSSGLGLAVLLAVAAGPTVADDIYVTITADTDDGFCGGPVNFPCSLRDAILLANAHPGLDYIHVPAGIYNLTIAGVGEDDGLIGDLDIYEEVHFLGAGVSTTTVDGQGLDRVFDLHHSAGWVAFVGLTIRGGDSSNSPGNQHGAGIASHGGGWTWIAMSSIRDNLTNNGHAGGVHQRGGALYVRNSTFVDNHARGGSGVAAYLANVDIAHSTFTDNYASDFGLTGTGGAIWFADSISRVYESTIAHNNSRLPGQPAGIFVHGGETEITSCTLFHNGYDEIFNDPTGGVTTLNLGNSVIQGTCNEYGITTLGGNVIGPGTGVSCQLGSYDLGARPIHLHPLGNYGGPTPTMPPVGESGNEIIDNPYAVPNCWGSDQRGIHRPQDGNGNGAAVCDSGAVEYRGLIFGNGFETGNTIRWSNTSP